MSSSPVPQGNYSAATRIGRFVYTAGMTPRDKGRLIARGKMLSDKPIHTYRSAVELAVDNALQAIRDQMEKGQHISQIASMTVYLATESGFEAHSKIADFASDRLFAQLNEAGIGSRTTVGVDSLPGNAPVEISLVAYL